MTKILLCVSSGKEALAVTGWGADILDIPFNEGQDVSSIDAAAQALDGHSRLSLTVSVPSGLSRLDPQSLISVDFLRVRTEKKQSVPDWSRLSRLARNYKIILIVNADDTDAAQWVVLSGRAKAAGFYGVMLESHGGHLLFPNRRYSIADIGRFVDETKRRGLVAGLAGALEAPDVPRLLPYSPDILAFHTSQLAGKSRAGMNRKGMLIRSLVPYEEDVSGNETVPDLGTDRIIITDFILDMHIGVYSHEKKRKHKVCFNVSVDVIRVSSNPEDMRHIFSYDLVLDGIRTMVSLGHVDLVETLAERIAAFILSFSRVRRVTVRVEKLELGPKAVGVEIIRTKQQQDASFRQKAAIRKFQPCCVPAFFFAVLLRLRQCRVSKTAMKKTDRISGMIR